MVDQLTPTQVAQLLANFYLRNGYIRRLDATRRSEEGQLYKKGAEIRLVAESHDELMLIRDLLDRAGFKLSEPFVKSQQWRQPIYGVAEAARFLTLVNWSQKAPPPVE